MKISINDSVIVRLTPAGEKAWANHWRSTLIQMKQMYPSGHKLCEERNGIPNSVWKEMVLPDGRVRFQIWDAMRTFGPDCYNGSNTLPFVNNEIEIEKA